MAVFEVGRVGYTQDYFSTGRVKPSENFSTEQNKIEQAKTIEPAAISATEDVTRGGNRVPSFRLQDLSESLGGVGELGMSGKDSKLQNLDIGKAVSDMQKDSVLQQYQYFVSDGPTTSDALSEDGMFFQKFSNI